MRQISVNPAFQDAEYYKHIHILKYSNELADTDL